MSVSLVKRSEIATRDNLTTIRAAIAAGDDVEYSSTGYTLWRVAPGEGLDPREIGARLGFTADEIDGE